MQFIKDVHLQFARFFKEEAIKPFLYKLSKKMEEGHICIAIHEEEPAETTLPEFCINMQQKAKALYESGLVAQSPSDYKPFVLSNGLLYLQRYHAYECGILEKIRGLLAQERSLIEARKADLLAHTDLIQDLFAQNAGIQATDWQLVACINTCLHNFSIISGGPGTGKTTTVAKILQVLLHINPTLSIALAAPTGKASARMAASMQHALKKAKAALQERLQQLEPSTLHRLLGYIPGSIYYKRNAQNPLPYDVIIIDECSMIDAALFAKLLDAVSPGTRLILLGDKDQLASVEAGSLFGDLCKSQSRLNIFSDERIKFINRFIQEDNNKINPDTNAGSSNSILFEHLVQLQYSHRFNSEEGIGQLSKAILTSNDTLIEQFFNNKDTRVEMLAANAEDAVLSFAHKYEAYTQVQDIGAALDCFEQQCILCATKEGKEGMLYVNKIVEDFLQSKNRISRSRSEVFYEHQPIMVNSNDYELKLFNGDIGIIRRNEEGALRLWFRSAESENGLRSVNPHFIKSHQTVYAMTIHKSQGSEFNEVLVVLPGTAGHQLLSRELLYTAVSRAKEKVQVCGSKALFLTGAAKSVSRTSGIQERLNHNA